MALREKPELTDAVYEDVIRRSDIIQLLPPDLLTSTLLCKILEASADEESIRVLAPRLPVIRGAIRLSMQKLEEHFNSKTLRIVQALLRYSGYWGTTRESVWDAIEHLDGCLEEYPTLYDAILVGSKDRTRVTFIEELFHGEQTRPVTVTYVLHLQVWTGLLRVGNLDLPFLQSVYDRNPLSDPCKDEDIISLLDLMIKNLNPTLYRWLFQKLAPLLAEGHYRVIYRSGSVDHIVASEEYANFYYPRICYSAEVVQNVKEYALWLIKTGRICHVEPRITYVLLDNEVIGDILSAYSLAETSKFNKLRTLILDNCEAHGLIDSTKLLLDSMGDAGYFSDMSKILHLPDTEVSNYIWSKSIDRWNSRRTIFELLQLDASDSITNRAIARIFKLDVDGKVISRFLLVISDFLIARNSPTTKYFLRSLLFGAEPSLTREITLMLCMERQTDLLVEFNDLIHETSGSQYHTTFNSAMLIALHELCNRILAGTCEYSSYRMCEIIMKIMDKGNVDLGLLLKVIKKSSLTLDLTTASIERFRAEDSLETLAFIDECMDHLIVMGFSIRKQFISDNRSLMGDVSMKILLKLCDPLRFGSDEEYLVKFDRYIFLHREEYLHAILEQFASCWSLVQERLLGFPTAKILGIRCTKDKLILGSHIFIRAERERICSQDTGRIILYEEIPVKIAVCGTCTERLRGELYTSKLDSFGTYYCRQCAQSIIDQENIARVACPVCMTEDSVTLEVMDCQHACCSSCLSAMSDYRRPACPVCRKLLNSPSIVRISADDAIKRFLS